jgi:hypothetical protein
LAIGGTPKLGILLNGFFQLRVSDLTLCPSCCDTYRSDKGSHNKDFDSDHNFFPIEELQNASEFDTLITPIVVCSIAGGEVANSMAGFPSPAIPRHLLDPVPSLTEIVRSLVLGRRFGLQAASLARISVCDLKSTVCCPCSVSSCLRDPLRSIVAL